ncbi:MAG: DUF4920 domain-containing protein [Cyclobacteriaceae bacterium]
MRLTYALFTLVFVIGLTSLSAQPPQGPVTPGTTFGEVISSDNAKPIADLPGIVTVNEAVHVKMIAKVVDVCPKKGCWISLEIPGQESNAFVKMKDYGFFVPVELIGKTVVVDAEAKMIKTSVEELKHYAEDAKKSKEEIEAITQPKEEIRLTANGILVVK